MTEIRPTTETDAEALTALYRETFPEEDLVPVVLELLAEPTGVLSLTLPDEDGLIGHVVYTDCWLAGDSAKLSLLAPLGIVPTRQKRGLGTSLVEAGLYQLRQSGTEFVFVLGDPNYYGRFGFKAEEKVRPPYDIPAEWARAWQSLFLGQPSVWPEGCLQVLKPWQNPAYWSG